MYRLSDETVLKQLQETLNNPQFDKWNGTSLSHVLLAYSGLNGKKVHIVAKQLLDKFYNWYNGSTFGLWRYLYKNYKGFPYSHQIAQQMNNTLYFYKKYGHLSKHDILTVIEKELLTKI